MLVSAVWLGAFCPAAHSELIPSDAAQVSSDQTREFLDLICPADAQATGCSNCPEETSYPGHPAWKLDTITFGHFLGAKSEDALSGGSGCESHANGLLGTYLFTKDQAFWRKVWYDPRENTDDCKKLAASDSRDLLVCSAQDMHQGLGDSFLYLLDPGQDPDWKPQTLDIFFGVDDTVGGCVKMPDATTVSGTIEQVTFVPAPKPPQVRISVKARVGKAVIPDAVLNACYTGIPATPAIATVSLRYNFIFTGQKIVAAPGNPPTKYNFAVAPLTAYHPANRSASRK